MLKLISAEWLKLSRRPLTWLLLAIFLILLVIQIVTPFLFALVIGSVSGPLGIQMAELVRGTSFPGVFGTALGHMNGIGGIFAIFLTAAAMGNEYNWGTLRTQLVRYPKRSHYALAKVLTIMLLLALATLITLLLASALGGLLNLWRSAPSWPSLTDIALLPIAILRALLVLLPYVLLTFWAAIAARSALVATGIGLLYLVTDVSLGALSIFAQLGGIWQSLYSIMIGQNVNALVLQNSHSFGLHPEIVTPALSSDMLPHPLLATFVLLLYSAVFLAGALWLFQRRDLTNPV